MVGWGASPCSLAVSIRQSKSVNDHNIVVDPELGLFMVVDGMRNCFLVLAENGGGTWGVKKPSWKSTS
jgi:hypothetical protein